MQSMRQRYEFLEVRFGRPSTHDLYDYLRAATAIVFDRGPPPQGYLAVSSYVHLCLRALTPIICSVVPYFDTFDGEVMKYGDSRILKENLRRALGGEVGDVLERAKSFVEERSSNIIAERLLNICLS